MAVATRIADIVDRPGELEDAGSVDDRFGCVFF